MATITTPTRWSVLGSRYSGLETFCATIAEPAPPNLATLLMVGLARVGRPSALSNAWLPQTGGGGFTGERQRRHSTRRLISFFAQSACFPTRSFVFCCRRGPIAPRGRKSHHAFDSQSEKGRQPTLNPLFAARITRSTATLSKDKCHARDF